MRSASIHRLALAASILAVSTAPGAEDRFRGGAFDGAASATYEGYAAPGPGALPRFVGGGYDGAADGRFSGYTPPDPGAAKRFVGSGFDGYAEARFSGFSLPGGGDLGRFLGGAADGYAAGSQFNYAPPTGGELGRFVGGGYDGYADSSAGDQSNPLAGDADGDGVPDWWEAGFYLSLAPDADADADGDGHGSLREYLADTDPTDPGSRLAITRLGIGSDIEVDLGSTSPNRLYWIEASDSLGGGTWTRITSPVAGREGATEIATPNLWAEEERLFFRAGVGLP
ncbi:MAG: hypothetical protein R3F11_10230 [Verrucomicrobiales bacterium]